jgi:urocanate hydratase
MGGAQPLAGYLAGATTLVIDADARKIQRRVDTGYCQHLVHDLDEAQRPALPAKAAGRAAAAEAVPKLLVLLSDENEGVRNYASVGLRGMGPAACPGQVAL